MRRVYLEHQTTKLHAKYRQYVTRRPCFARLNREGETGYAWL